MWLWLSLCFASSVIAQNDILASGTSATSKKPNRVNEEVLLKIWTIFADLLDADGKTVKVPSRDHIQFALTLIKKTILENTDSPNVDLQEKLFLREAELAKYKGVYILDNRPLQTLLDLDLNPEKKSNLMFKYELRANDSPNCKQAFQELIQKLHQNYNNLANSPVCSEGPINFQPAQYSLYNTGDTNQYALVNTNTEPTSNNVGNIAATWNYNSNVNVGGLIQNPNSLKYKGELKEVFGTAQIPVLNTNEQNNLLHAVKLSKDTHHLIGNDYTADLEHAKNVADRIKALYQPSNTLTPPTDLSLYPKKPLRELNTNFGAANIEPRNNPWTSSQYARPDVQSYITQNQVNPSNNGWNQSYTIITNSMQSRPSVKNTILNQDNRNPLNTFINSKYHPNLGHNDELTNKELPSNTLIANVENILQTNSGSLNKKLSLNFYSHPNQNKEQNTEIPQQENIAPYPLKTPSRTVPSVKRNNNYLNYNIYSYPKPNNPNFLQNSYANRPGYNPYGLKFNYYNNPNQIYSQVSALRPGYARGYNNYMFQQSVAHPQGNLLTTKYLNQNPNAIFGQKILQSIPPFQSFKDASLSKPIQNYAYGMTHIQTNVPQFTHTSNYFKVQPVIDKLADWVSGTNSAKLNSDNDDAEIELTYLINKPPPTYSPKMFYIKFRMPYKSFANQISELLKTPSSRSASPETDLYTNLASQYNASVIPSEMSAFPEDMKSTKDKLLVRARYIEPNVPGKNNPNSVDIINLVKEPELNHANIGNPLNTAANNAQIPVLLN